MFVGSFGSCGGRFYSGSTQKEAQGAWRLRDLRCQEDNIGLRPQRAAPLMCHRAGVPGPAPGAVPPGCTRSLRQSALTANPPPGSSLPQQAASREGHGEAPTGPPSSRGPGELQPLPWAHLSSRGQRSQPGAAGGGGSTPFVRHISAD